MRQVWQKVLLLLGGIATIWGVVALFSAIWHALIAFVVALLCFLGSRVLASGETVGARTTAPAPTNSARHDAAPVGAPATVARSAEDEPQERDEEAFASADIPEADDGSTAEGEDGAAVAEELDDDVDVESGEQER